jgi:hypothetical protein
MRKLLVICLLSFFIIFSLFSGQHISIPLNHRVYDILESAQLRGIIDPISSVKPYARSIILKNLSKVIQSNALTHAEYQEVKTIMDDLEFDYDTPADIQELLLNGAYATYWEEYSTGVAFGVNFDAELTHSLVERGVYDSRNAIRFYIRGDILDFASINMDFGFRMDHLDTRLFLANDFTIPSEGKYETLFDPSVQHSHYYGLDMTPEISLQFLEGNLQFRWGSVQRDWGVGINNLMISGSARSFEGIETAIALTPWLDYQFIAGSLGMFWVTHYIDTAYNSGYFDEYIFSDDMQGTRLSNNFTAHRVEAKLPWNVTFGIYESVLYRKRFELAYLNPFSILMFQQNALGDFDNMLAGVDIQWRIPGLLRLYGAAATTEMSEINPLRFFKAPRNIMGLQGGVDVHIPAGQFSKITFQYTYLGPFFYTHYPVDLDYNGDGEADLIYDLMYVNKGQNLGYPLRPNSDEFLLSAQFGLPNGWRTDVVGKFQRRSGQYGANIDEYMVYRAAATGNYDDKDFNGNIFERNLGLEVGVSKTLSDYPVTFRFSYIYNMKMERSRVPVLYWDFDTPNGSPTSDPTAGDVIIKYEVSGPWSDPTHTHAVQFGVTIWN